MKNIKHYFASANTSTGFVNKFNYINDKNKPHFLYILKGGPGSGKSTFMKKVGKHFHELGEDVEYFHCSSDISSLDGVRLANRNIAIVDGTSPHITECAMPAITDKIVNLGEFIGDATSANKTEIEALISDKSKFFKNLYKVLEIAGKLYDLIFDFQTTKDDNMLANIKFDKIISGLDCFKAKNKTASFLTKDISDNKSSAYSRELFLSCFSDIGKISFESENKFSLNICIDSSLPINKIVLDKLATYFCLQNFEVSKFFDLLAPSKIESLYVTKLGLYFWQKPNNYINLENIENQELYMSILNQLEYYELKAGKLLEQAKQKHKEIENYYIKNMDFESISDMSDNIITEIKSKIQSTNN